MLSTLCLTLALAPLPAPQDSVPAAPLVKPMEASTAGYGELEQEYRKAYGAWISEIQALADQEGGVEAYPEDPTVAYYPRFTALAESGDLDARLWCLENFHMDTHDEATKADWWLGEFLSVAHLAKDNDAQRARLSRCLFGGMMLPDWHDLDRAAVALERLSPEDEKAEAIGMHLSLLSYHEHQDAALKARQQEVEARLLAEWPQSKAAARLLGQRFAREHLQQGMVAPDISGADVDGKALSLAALRGKVVVVDFWGFW